MRSHAKQPGIGKEIDTAMDTIEKDNPILKDVLPRELGAEDIERIAGTYHRWRDGGPKAKYEEVKGFCNSAWLERLGNNDLIL
ncbi:hypothetical protein AGMMS49940_09190 [Spirochaetia bacterium]|nr:hypothetical protein AGMMS49940_09190 [Spirochaetia bacterium]